MTEPASTRPAWEARSAGLAWRINAAAWAAEAAPYFFLVVSGFAVGAYALRRLREPVLPAVAVAALAGVAAAAVVGWRLRRRFFTRADARILLESHLRLDARLTAAEAGLVPWPAVPRPFPSLLRWRWIPLGGWFLGSILMAVAALTAPLPQAVAVVHAAGSPPALLQTEAMVNALKDQQLADPLALDAISDKARELGMRPADEQYSQSALEAADALRDHTAAAAASLARSLNDAAEALSQQSDANGSATAANRLSAALSALRDGALPPDSNLLNSLPSSTADLSQLSAADRAKLAQRLGDAAGKAGAIAGAAGAGVKIAKGAGRAGLGTQPGAGGKGGGGPPAPLSLSSEQSHTGYGDSENLHGTDLQRVALGDKVGVDRGRFDADPHALGPMSAGAVSGSGHGGDPVWVSQLDPREQAAVKDVFK